MAETTPGPLIMVVQFVGFMAAYRHPGPLSPLVGGIVASLLTTWVTFVPCFLWILLEAPYIEGLRGNRLLGSALSAITAAVVGVILNLAVWFSLHTLFAVVTVHRFNGLRIELPQLATIDPAACAIAALACGLTFYWRRGMALTLGTSAALGAAWFWLRGGSAGARVTSPGSGRDTSPEPGRRSRQRRWLPRRSTRRWKYSDTLTSPISTGTSTSGPTTAASAAPESRPNTATATAIASSKLLLEAVKAMVAVRE